jgi:hypothetical protein
MNVGHFRDKTATLDTAFSASSSREHAAREQSSEDSLLLSSCRNNAALDLPGSRDEAAVHPRYRECLLQANETDATNATLDTAKSRPST